MIDGPRERPIPIGLRHAGVGALEQGELIARGIGGERRKSNPDEPLRDAACLAQFGEQRPRDLPDDAVGDHWRIERAARLPRLEIEVAHPNGDRARRQPVGAKVAGCSRDEREELTRERLVIRNVGRERLVAADAIGVAVRLHRAVVDPADAIEQPASFARPKPL